MANRIEPRDLVLETSAFLDLVVGSDEGRAVRNALGRHVVHVSDHATVEVAMALRVLRRNALLSQAELASRIRLLAAAPFQSHPAQGLLAAAAGRSGLRLGDALGVELSDRLAAPLVTTDPRLATVWPRCWLISAPAQASAAGSPRPNSN